MADVEQLNQMALKGEIDVSKVSFHAYMHILQSYVLLNSGSALGNNCGPLLISKRPYKLSDIPNLKIAIPGTYTTANLLLKLAFSEVKETAEMIFSDIEEAIINGSVDAGVIIHENRFTYANKGLKKIIDLGQLWEGRTNYPIPLGGIVASRKLELPLLHKIDRLINKSVAQAFLDPEASHAFVRKYAQELSDDVIYQHINTYVTKFSFDLGESGRNAVTKLFAEARTACIIDSVPKSLFLGK
jgi:1,4-dihydroxy-6-naphthoate synthase